MNIANAKTLVSQLERLSDKQFNMDTWVRHTESCGTVACIAGWCSILNGGPNDSRAGSQGGGRVASFAVEFLDIEPPEEDRLFYGAWLHDGPFGLSPRVGAIAELNRMIAEVESA